jgi:hypothetical protein
MRGALRVPASLLVCCLLLVPVLAALLPVDAGAGIAASRTSRPFDEKIADLRHPMAPVETPLPLRRTVMPKSMVRLEPGPEQRSDRFIVKFSEGLRVRLRDGALVELGGRALPGVSEAVAQPGVARIERLLVRSEEDIERDRAFAIARSGVQVADLNNYYLVHLEKDADRAATLAAWLGLEVVELAYFEGDAVPACTDIAPPTPDFVSGQNYLEPAPTGVDAFAAWAWHPAGAGVPEFLFVDIEYSWNVDHEDFGDVAVLNGTPEPDMNHGTAVLGVVVACDSDFGMKGIAHRIAAGGVNWANEPSGAAVFDRAASFLMPGEIYLIELHTSGPGPIPGWVCECNCGQFGYVPMEWDQSLFDSIQLHTAAGLIVVEAGGNGGMDLDDPFYGGLFDRSLRDSGAILVGAGSPGTHAPECWTNYGSRIDCQGYGNSVFSTGVGNLWDPGDENQWYTNSFSGTSSASPVVTGCAAVIQNLAQQTFGLTLDAITLRAALSLYGTAQGDPQSKHIGVLPDLAALLDAWFRLVIEHTPLEDTQNEVDDYEVAATVTPALLNGAVSAVTIHYSVSGGGWQSAAMSPGGVPGSWQGWIPAQPGGSYVRYYLEATPEQGQPETDPAAGEAAPLYFIVGEMVAVAEDPLETATGWTVGAPGDDATAGFWEHGDPHGTWIGPIPVAPEDDHTPAPGVGAFVTGNPGPGAAPSDGDVDDGRTTLLSPVFDLTAEIYVRIGMWIWTQFLFDDVLSIDISNDGGQTWMPLDAIGVDSAAWQEVEYTVTRETLPYTDQMRLRCVASDYGTASLVECGIDDLVFRGLRQPSQAVAPPPTPAPPRRLLLGPAVPNPFAATAAGTRFTIALPAAGDVRLAIYDVAGRLVRSLVDGHRAAGTLPVRWDGRNEGGEMVAPGVYFVRLEAAGEHRVRSVVRVR